MVGFEVELTDIAKKYYKKTSGKTRKGLDKCFTDLSQTPLVPPLSVSKIVGYDNFWRYRVGDIRVIFTVDEDLLLVTVISILPRGSAYKKL